jgi:hypothetical protein
VLYEKFSSTLCARRDQNLCAMATVVLSDNVIRVIASDGPCQEPPDTTRIEDPDGNANFYRLCSLEEYHTKLWLSKSGQALATHLNATQDTDIEVKKARLEDFPQGYKLYQHVKKFANDHNKDRTDMYLYGTFSRASARK